MNDVQKVVVTLNINGETHTTLCPPYETLLETLRERLDLTGTKHGCELGECSACTVLLDGEPVLSCLTLSVQAQGHALTTIEGVAAKRRPAPITTSVHRVRRVAVRLLHSCDGAYCQGAARKKPITDA